MGFDIFSDLRGWSGCHDPSTAVAAIGPQIDNPVRSFDHVHVVFDHQYRVAAVDQSL